MDRYVLELETVDRTQSALVGGKAAHLGELARVEALRVPDGFCVTTAAFERAMSKVPAFRSRLVQLARTSPIDGAAIEMLAAELREMIADAPMPTDIVAAIDRELERLGEHAAYAVRSSATAEDLPTASFAGQQDTYLNVVGRTAILRHVSLCWASLFTGRAVVYRNQNDIDHGKVRMAVVVQRMVLPHASGVVFTAHPVNGRRTHMSIEATFGLGEALVSGLVTPDIYEVVGDEVVRRSIAAKEVVVVASAAGGVEEALVEDARRQEPVLADAQIRRLATLARRIESHFGSPQDIEWCLADEEFQIVQSRPITTLFPVPVANDDERHVYISVGHNQMMTDAMRPLGLSFWQRTTPRPMAEAGGRLFVDVAQALAGPDTRAGLFAMIGRSDPLIGDALRAVVERGDLLPAPPAPVVPAVPPAAPIATDPRIVDDLIAQTQASIAALERGIASRTGTALLDFILADIQELRRILFDRTSHQAIMAGMESAWWLNDQLEAWLGEKNAADVLTQSVPNNVTSEMGLALLDVADVIRRHPAVVAFLEHADDDGFLEELRGIAGGQEVRDAIGTWLARYGMRGVGEIDITRPRWSERPTMLLPVLLGHVRNAEPGESARRFAHGQEAARAKETELLRRLRALPDGEARAEEAKRMIDRVRTFAGFREYPKYGMVSRYFVYKQALMREATRLVESGALRERDDIFFLRFEELQDVVRTGRVDQELLRQRREAFASYERLTPPRVMTSDGEIITGAYRRETLPAGALPGLPVSSGLVEGRARVLLNPADATLEPADILVTVYTDPSWTPLFVGIRGLVTEVGGLMTHGAVIAREYGLPAVVGVEHATRLIRDGQRIRVHGTEGYVELLD